MGIVGDIGDEGPDGDSYAGDPGTVTDLTC